MLTHVSIGNDPAIFRVMATSLGTYIRDRRIALGFRTQGDFAITAGINRAHLSQIESGKIALPNADLRRKLASALGVSHVDILVAAGELEPEEVEAASVQGVVEERPPPEGIATLLRDTEWTAQSTQLVTSLLGYIRDAQRGTYNVSDPREADRDYREE